MIKKRKVLNRLDSLMLFEKLFSHSSRPDLTWFLNKSYLDGDILKAYKAVASQKWIQEGLDGWRWALWGKPCWGTTWRLERPLHYFHYFLKNLAIFHDYHHIFMNVGFDFYLHTWLEISTNFPRWRTAFWCCWFLAFQMQRSLTCLGHNSIS